MAYVRLLVACVSFLFVPAASHAAQHIVEGEWKFFYAPNEDIYKMMFAIPDSFDPGVYFRCSPASNKIEMTFDAPRIDVRTYRPSIRTEKTNGDPRFELGFSEVASFYQVEQIYTPNSIFLKSLISGDDLLIDEAKFPVNLPDDGRLFREFIRSCAADQ